MPRTVKTEIQVYLYNELSDEAQSVARKDFRQAMQPLDSSYFDGTLIEVQELYAAAGWELEVLHVEKVLGDYYLHYTAKCPEGKCVLSSLAAKMEAYEKAGFISEDLHSRVIQSAVSMRGSQEGFKGAEIVVSANNGVVTLVGVQRARTYFGALHCVARTVLQRHCDYLNSTLYVVQEITDGEYEYTSDGKPWSQKNEL